MVCHHVMISGYTTSSPHPKIFITGTVVTPRGAIFVFDIMPTSIAACVGYEDLFSLVDVTCGAEDEWLAWTTGLRVDSV